jgi:hypothetical protein
MIFSKFYAKTKKYKNQKNFKLTICQGYALVSQYFARALRPKAKSW